MNTFEDFKIKKQLLNALNELGITTPTPIQNESYSTIMSGKDFVGIAQTGTGKTFAYLLPVLQNLQYSDQLNPRVLILAPTRELVIQIEEEINKLTDLINVRTLCVYGGTNIMTQKRAILQGVDILVGTPRRLYDLALSQVLKLTDIKQLVIDEVDIMMDFGYKTQLNHIFDYLKPKRQNILFSATMTSYVDELIDSFLTNPTKLTISVSGIPLENINQVSYEVPNFYTKANLLNELLTDSEQHHKVLIFTDSKASADLLQETLDFASETSVIHAGKEQNQRSKAIEKFEDGTSRILIATDVISRGIDLDKISTVISFDTPKYPENYIHRIGRTGRAGEKGQSILFFKPEEMEAKKTIEELINHQIEQIPFPDYVEVSTTLSPEEKPKPKELGETLSKDAINSVGASFHEKKEKNKKENKKKSYQEQLKQRYKKPIRRGDKIQNMKSKRKKK